MSKRKKILFLIAGLRPGGAEKVCVGILNALFEDGYDVSLMILNTHKAELYPYINKNIPVYNLEVNHARSSFTPLKNLLFKLEVDICLSFNYQISIQLILIKKFFRLNYIIISRGISTFSKLIEYESSILHKYINAFIIKTLYRKSDFFIAQSTGMKEDMIKSMRVPKDKIKVIFNPNFVLQKDNTIILDRVENKTKRILFVGSLSKVKNISFLLDCIKELTKTRTDFYFDIVGDGVLREELEAKSIDLGLAEIVRFRGYSNKAYEYFMKSDLFVLGSLYEGFPNVLIEAISFGLPVVSIDCMSGPIDIIENDINGYLVLKYDPILFSEYLTKALDKNWDLDRLKKSVDKFNFNNILDQYKEIINEQ